MTRLRHGGTRDVVSQILGRRPPSIGYSAVGNAKLSKLATATPQAKAKFQPYARAGIGAYYTASAGSD